jgi:hypothetical protein
LLTARVRGRVRVRVGARVASARECSERAKRASEASVTIEATALQSQRARRG